jgi:hypothetical protein
MPTQFKRKLMHGIRQLLTFRLVTFRLVTFRLVIFLIGLGLMWSQQPIAASAQTPAPKPVLLQQANDKSAPQQMSEGDRAKLNDPFFQLVLKNNANAKTLPEIKQLLKPSQQNVFVVDEKIADKAPKVGNSLANRRAIITMAGTTSNQVLDNNVLFSVGFNSERFPTANFIEVMGWDDKNSLFNYYKFDQRQGETVPSWKFRGNSKDADLLSASARQGTCMQCHINGTTVMKELFAPWNHWDSIDDQLSYLRKGQSGSWPIVNAANSPLADLGGAEALEGVTLIPTIERFNTRQIASLKSSDGKSIRDARRILKPLFATTEFNLISSGALSPLHPLRKSNTIAGDVTVPGRFFLNQQLLSSVGVFGDVNQFQLSMQDYAHLVSQTKTKLADVQPGDTNFAWFGPEASFVDNNFVQQLVEQNIIPKEFVAAVLSIDVETPVFSSSRAKLWSDKILPATFQVQPTNDLIPQVVKNLEALKPVAGTPEDSLLQLLRQPQNVIKNVQQKVNQYVTRETNLLGDKAKPAERSQEWIRLYKLALQRRETLLSDPVLKALDETGGKLLLARGDVAANVAALPSTIVASKPRPTLRLGSTGEDVVFLQRRLQAIGVFSGTIDGDFGPKTQAAVIAAQKRLGLTADGVVGNSTWAALQTANNVA